MIYQFETEGVFVSKLNGNEQLPAEQQVRIDWKLPTAGQKYKIIKQQHAFDNLGNPILDENGKQCIRIDCDIDELLKACAVKVHNVAIGEKKINTGSELASTPLYDLHDEFACLMLEKIHGVFTPKN